MCLLVTASSLMAIKQCWLMNMTVTATFTRDSLRRSTSDISPTTSQIPTTSVSLLVQVFSNQKSIVTSLLRVLYEVAYPKVWVFHAHVSMTFHCYNVAVVYRRSIKRILDYYHHLDLVRSFRGTLNRTNSRKLEIVRVPSSSSQLTWYCKRLCSWIWELLLID